MFQRVNGLRRTELHSVHSGDYYTLVTHSRARKDDAQRALQEENAQLKQTVEELQLENAALKTLPRQSMSDSGVSFSSLAASINGNPLLADAMFTPITPIETRVLDSFGTQYRDSVEGQDPESYSNSMDELFDILQIPLPVEEQRLTCDQFPSVNIEELCELFKVCFFNGESLVDESEMRED